MDQESKYKYVKPIDIPRSTHYGNNYWIFHSVKLNRSVTAYSNLEYYNLIILEMTHDVEWYCEQPLKASVMMTTDIKPRKIIPDVYVLYRSGREEFQEIKYSDEYNSETDKGLRDRAQVEAEQQWCKENHYDFSLRTENEICTGRYFIQNLEIMSTYVRRQNGIRNKNIASAIALYLDEHDYVKISDLVEAHIMPKETALSEISLQYYFGDINLHMSNKPLSLSVEVENK